MKTQHLCDTKAFKMTCFSITVFLSENYPYLDFLVQKGFSLSSQLSGRKGKPRCQPEETSNEANFQSSDETRGKQEMLSEAKTTVHQQLNGYNLSKKKKLLIIKQQVGFGNERIRGKSCSSIVSELGFRTERQKLNRNILKSSHC